MTLATLPAGDLALTNAHWTVEPGDAGLRLDKYLAAATRLASRARATRALDRGKIFINDDEVDLADAGRRLAVGDRVRVWMDRPGSARRRADFPLSGGLHIVYEDEVLIVVDKPAGLLAVPLPRRGEAPSVYHALQAHLEPGRRRPFVVHRIDRDTSGLVVFAKDPRTQQALKAQFIRREPERVYQAVVYGEPTPPSGTWRDHLVWDTGALIQKETHPRDPRASEAECEYRVLERFRAASLIEVRLRTGRQNQIRIQARLRGHTLVGERRYVYGPDVLRPIAFKRQALHAWRLGFRHPDGRPLQFEAPPPADFAELVARLRRKARGSQSGR